MPPRILVLCAKRRSRSTFLAVVVLAALSGTPAMADNPDSPYGLNVHLPFSDFHFSMLEQAAEAGIDWVRIDFSWFDAEASQGNYNWAKFDTFTAEAQALGLNIFASLGAPPSWALEYPEAQSGEPGYRVIEELDAWYAFVDQSVQRYAGVVDHWGIWNEPDLTASWYGTRQEYIDDIFIPTADAIHAANPDAMVVGPGLSMLANDQPTGPWYDWLDDLFLQAGDKIDIFDFHCYRGTRNELNFRIEWDGDISFLYDEPPGTTILTTASIRANLDVYGWDGPVWMTETGWGYDPEDPCFASRRLTETLEDWYTGDPNRSWLDKTFFYHMWDGPTYVEGGEGLFHTDGTPRETFYAYADFIADYPVPEASTLALLAIAGALGRVRRRGRRS